MNNFFLENIINKKLNCNLYKNDFVPNGLQIEGIKKIKKIILGVTACKKLLLKAVQLKADAIMVHHGYFWNNENPRILGMKYKRLKIILSNNINLYSWHFPLDFHSTLGNNVTLGNFLNIKIKGNLSPYVMWGILEKERSKKFLKKFFLKKLNRKPFYCGKNGPKKISKIAWCSGKGQKYISTAILNNMDAFLTGEVSEETVHEAEENKIHFFSLGHHMTEKFGIQKLGSWLKTMYPNLIIKFVDIYNPI